MKSVAFAEPLAPLLRSDRDLRHLIRIGRRHHALQDLPHLLRPEYLDRQPFVVLAIGKEPFLGRMRERQMSEVVKERAKPNDLSPCNERRAVGKDVDGRMPVVFVRDDVEYPAGQLHDAERVLEPAVRRAWVDEIGERELVNVPEALKRPGVDRCDLIGCDSDEVVNRIANLALMLRHAEPS